MTYWLFQGNPKYYRIIDGIRDFEQMPWLTTRYAKDIAPGAEMLNPNTKLYISSYTNSKKPKIVNMTSSPQTNEHN
jgi:hypothetical protein